MPRPRKPDAKREQINVKVTAQDKEKLKKYAEREGITLSEAIQRFIEGLNID